MNLPLHPAVFGPRLQTVEIDIGAEAQRVEIAAKLAAQLPHRLQIDQMQAFLRDMSEKLWPGAVTMRGAPFNSPGI